MKKHILPLAFLALAAAKGRDLWHGTTFNYVRRQ